MILFQIVCINFGTPCTCSLTPYELFNVLYPVSPAENPRFLFWCRQRKRGYIAGHHPRIYVGSLVSTECRLLKIDILRGREKRQCVHLPGQRGCRKTRAPAEVLPQSPEEVAAQVPYGQAIQRVVDSPSETAGESSFEFTVYTHTQTHTHIYIYIYTYVLLLVVHFC